MQKFLLYMDKFYIDIEFIHLLGYTHGKRRWGYV